MKHVTVKALNSCNKFVIDRFKHESHTEYKHKGETPTWHTNVLVTC